MRGSIVIVLMMVAAASTSTPITMVRFLFWPDDEAVVASSAAGAHFTRVMAGGCQPPFSTAGFGEYARNTRKNAPSGAGSQFAFASPPDGSSAEIAIVNDPSSFALRPLVRSPIEYRSTSLATRNLVFA